MLTSFALVLCVQIAQAQSCSNSYAISPINLCDGVTCASSYQCESGSCEVPSSSLTGLGSCAKDTSTSVKEIVMYVLGGIALSIALCVLCCCMCCRGRDRLVEKQLVVHNQNGGYPGATPLMNYQPLPQQAYQ